MSDDIKVTDGTILEALNGKIDYDGGNFAGSGLEEVVNNYLAENADFIGYDEITDEVVDVEILEQGYVSDYEFKEAIGDISTVLDTINGEVV